MFVAYDPNDKEQASLIAALNAGERGSAIPSTWQARSADIAARYGLNYSRPADVNAGKFYVAQEAYANNTGRSLNADLDAGQTSFLESALRSIWPSVQGSASAPQGLVQTLSGVGRVGDMQNGQEVQAIAQADGNGGLVETVAQFFARFGLVILGGIIVFVALWNILANTGAVPSPGQTVSAAARAVAAA